MRLFLNSLKKSREVCYNFKEMDWRFYGSI